MHIDVSRAYFHAKAQRLLLIRLPVEYRLGTDSGKVGLMKKSMYGTRVAASNWERDWQEHIRNWCFQLGLSSKNLFHHKGDRVSGLTHGDDFVLTGPTKKLMEFERKMTSVYPIKAKIIGYGSPKSIKTLNRRLHSRKRGIVYQHDPRHVDVLVKDLGLEHGNSVQTPATPDVTEGRVGTVESGSASQIQVTGCQMFVPQSRPSRHNIHCERVVSKDVESQSTEPCQAKKACQVFETRDKSSAEAEQHAVASGASEAKGVQSMMRDLGFAVKPVLAIDAKAIEHILHRQGIWKLKHIDVAYLWVLRVRRVRSEENVADLGTKPLSKTVIAKHCLTLGYVIMDEENIWSGQQVCSGTSVQQSAHSGRQEVTVSRSQPVETRSNRSSCRVRSSSSEHREVARDVKEDVAPHCLGLRHIAQIDFGKCRQGEYIRVLPRKHHQSRRRTFPLHGTHDKSLQSIMKCYDDIHENLHDDVMSFTDTASNGERRSQRGRKASPS